MEPDEMLEHVTAAREEAEATVTRLRALEDALKAAILNRPERLREDDRL